MKEGPGLADRQSPVASWKIPLSFRAPNDERTKKMKPIRAFSHAAGLALAVALIVLMSTLETKAQVVISDEKLVATTLVVDKNSITVTCGIPGCNAEAPILSSIPVTCPAATGGTCTFHMSFDANVGVGIPDCGNGCSGTSGASNSYQFLVDSAAPVPGPTTTEGWYVFGRNVSTDDPYNSRISYPASVVATVTNSGSRKHLIQVNLGCVDDLKFAGCRAVARMSTLRVDVFEP